MKVRTSTSIKNLDNEGKTKEYRLCEEAQISVPLSFLHLNFVVISQV